MNINMLHVIYHIHDMYMLYVIYHQNPYKIPPSLCANK